MGKKKSLFEIIVDDAKMSESFRKTRTADAALPTRQMLDEIYQEFPDPDGNFVEQFQTTGFDARCFELYLFAYFLRSGYAVDRGHPNPDFLVTRNGLTVAVEATTTNPSTSGILSKLGKQISDLSEEEMDNYLANELPIRFGSPLYSKLKNNKYWELEHCHGLPFVIAIEAFHDEEALALTDHALAQYVYGIHQTAKWSSSGELEIHVEPVSDHILGGKVIPSNFFGQEDAEHVSAIVFSNSGTYAKFTRMGYQSGHGCDVITVTRTGFSFNPDPDAMDPTFFSYSLDAPPFVEPWGQGLVVLHNPECLHPIAEDFFIDAAQGYIEDGVCKFDHSSWHPFASKTMVFHLGDTKKKIPPLLRNQGPLAVGAINKNDFHAACGISVLESNPIVQEDGWFSDESGSFLGVVIRDKADNDWGFVILARDEFFRFRAIYNESSTSSHL